MCLAPSAIGRSMPAPYASRPGPELNRPVFALGDADAANGGALAATSGSIVTRVDVRGPIMQRAQATDPCGGFVDGHDTIAERIIAALNVGNVLLVFDTPGGAYAGAEQAIAAVLAAKELHGRRIEGWVDELCASIGFWWAACVCDSLHSPPAGQTGSIGARSSHMSTAGALAQAGIAPTFSYWPNEGKIDGVAELPLTAGGKARMDRAVNEAGEAFALAVSSSPFGKAHGLTRNAIVALSADCLSAPLALAAGLIDGIATFGEVQGFALATASAGGMIMPGIKGEGAPPEHDEDDDKDKVAGGDDEGDDKPLKPSSTCSSCNMGNSTNAKFCSQCGDSMAAKPIAEEDPAGPAPEAVRAALATVKAHSLTETIAAILGATAASDIAIKTAAIQLRLIRDTAAGVTGQASSDGIVGGLLSVPSRLEAAAQIQAARKVELATAKKTEAARKAESEKAERHALCIRGIATGAPEMARGRVMRDIVSASGERTGIEFHAVYAEMSLGTLRGLVEGLEASAPPKNPFTADKAAAKAIAAPAETAASFSPVEKKALEKHPSVQLLQRRGSALSADKIVESLIVNDPTSARGFLAQNGAAA